MSPRMVRMALTIKTVNDTIDDMRYYLFSQEQFSMSKKYKTVLAVVGRSKQEHKQDSKREEPGELHMHKYV